MTTLTKLFDFLLGWALGLAFLVFLLVGKFVDFLFGLAQDFED